MRTLELLLASVVIVRPDPDISSLPDSLQIKLPIISLEQYRIISDPTRTVTDGVIVTTGIGVVATTSARVVIPVVVVPVEGVTTAAVTVRDVPLGVITAAVGITGSVPVGVVSLGAVAVGVVTVGVVPLGVVPIGVVPVGVVPVGIVTVEGATAAVVPAPYVTA